MELPLQHHSQLDDFKVPKKIRTKRIQTGENRSINQSNGKKRKEKEERGKREEEEEEERGGKGSTCLGLYPRTFSSFGTSVFPPDSQRVEFSSLLGIEEIYQPFSPHNRH